MDLNESEIKPVNMKKRRNKKKEFVEEKMSEREKMWEEPNFSMWYDLNYKSKPVRNEREIYYEDSDLDTDKEDSRLNFWASSHSS